LKAEKKSFVERLRALYIVMLLVLGALATTILIKAGRQVASPTVEVLSKQEVATAGGEISAKFKLYNPGEKPRTFTYALYLNNSKRYEDKVLVMPESSFVFGGHYRVFEPGIVAVTALVYDADGKKLLENTTHYVRVEEANYST